MTVLIRIFGRPDSIAGQFVKSFEHNTLDGLGYGEFTFDPLQAMQFTSREAALEFYFRRSTLRPYRPDGGENRPLTASHAEFITLGQAIMEAVRTQLPLL